MILIIESIILCAVFTLFVFIMSRDPIKTLYNYPPKIQERVKSLDEYKDRIPTQKKKVSAKLFACVLFVAVLSLILRFVNGYTTFLTAFGYGFLLWTVVNLWDMIVLDIIHMSNIQARDDFRRTSLTAPACIAQIAGLGADGYEFALRALVRRLSASGQTL